MQTEVKSKVDFTPIKKSKVNFKPISAPIELNPIADAYGRAQMAAGMVNPSSDRNVLQLPSESEVAAIKATPTTSLSAANELLGYAGNVARAVPADIAAGVSGQPRFAGNVPAAVMDKPLPIDEALAMSAQQEQSEGGRMGAAITGKISQGLAGMAPMIAAFSGLPAVAQKIAAGAFTADQLYQAKDVFTQLGDELGKPEKEQDADKLSSLYSTAAQLVGFTAAGAAPVASVGRNVALTKGDALRISARDLMQQVKDTPLSPTYKKPLRELGFRLNENALDRPEVAPIVEQAFAELGSVFVPERFSAAEQLRQEQLRQQGVRVAETQATRATERRTQKEGVEGGKLPAGTPVEASPTPGFLKTAEQKLSNRQQPLSDVQPAKEAPTSTPLKDVETLLRERLAKRDIQGAVDALASQPADVSRKLVDDVMGVNRDKVGLDAAEKTIFNKTFDAIIEKLERQRLGEKYVPQEMSPTTSTADYLKWREGKDVQAEQAKLAQTMTPEELQRTADQVRGEVERMKQAVDPTNPDSIQAFADTANKLQFWNETLAKSKEVKPKQPESPWAGFTDPGKSGQRRVRNFGTPLSDYFPEKFPVREEFVDAAGWVDADAAGTVRRLNNAGIKTLASHSATKADHLNWENLPVDARGQAYISIADAKNLPREFVKDMEKLGWFYEGDQMGGFRAVDITSNDFRQQQAIRDAYAKNDASLILPGTVMKEIHATRELWDKTEAVVDKHFGKAKPSEPSSAKPAEVKPAEKIPPSPSQPAPAAEAVKPSPGRVSVDPKTDELLGTNNRGEKVYWSDNAKTHYSISEGKVRTAPWTEGLSESELARLEKLSTPEPKLSTPETKAATPARDWDLFYEDLVGDLDSFSPARDTGKRNYALDDMAQRFVDYAKADKSGKPLSQLVSDFAKTDEASKSQIKKLRESVKNLESQPTITTPETKTGALDTAISNIESLQKKIRGTGSDLNMGVPAAILDTALEVARVALKAGKSVKEAVDAAVAHIRANHKGEFREMELRRMVMGEMERPAGASGAAGGSTPPAAQSRPATPSPAPAAPSPASPPGTPPRPPAGAPAPAPAPGATTLADIYKIFEPAPKSPFKPKQKAIQVVEALRTGLASKFRPINKLAEDIAKSYGLTRPKDIAGIFEQLKGSQGKGEADVYRFDREVSSLVKGHEKDFNPYMFLRRTLDRLNQDAADVAAGLPARRSVSAYTIPEIQAKLSLLESNLGPEVVAKFQQAADGYQRYMDNALRLQVESGRMSQEVYDAIKNGNQFYAPFKVMKYLEQTSRPEGVGSKIDTMAEFTQAMKGIEDADFRLGDMLGAARQSILISRILADKNMAMRHISELAAFDPRGDFIKRIPSGANAPAGMEIVNVLENGKQKRYAVNPDVAQALQIYGGTAGGVLSKMLSYASVPFRAGATALNLPFQVSNLLADIPRQALISKYGIRQAQDIVRYPLDFVHSLFSSIEGDVFGRDNKLFQDFLDSGVAGTTVQEFLTPEALKFKEPTTMGKGQKVARGVINLIPEFAAAIEQTSKVMGVKRAMRFEGVSSGKELAKQVPEAITELRRYSGSPDFGRQGKWIEGARLNLLYMFLNARVQGLTADVSRLAGAHGGKTTAVTWFRLASAVGIPSAYLYFLNQRPENKADYEKRPLQERQNYWLIPKDDENGNPRYITTEDGEKVRDYWRIPKRESAKWMANYTEAALNFAKQRNPQAALDFGNSMLQEISPVNIQGENATEKLESMASGLNPLIKAPLELATGRDLYRHRDIMSDQLKKASPELQYNERTAEAFKLVAEKMPDVAPEFLRSPIVLENLTRNLTAGLLTQFLPRKPIEGRGATENTALLQRFQSLPYTDQQAFKEQIGELERAAADEQLTRHRAAVKLMDENKGANIEQIIGKIQFKTDDDVKLARQVVDMWVAKENGATFQDRQILALPTKQRALYVATQLEGLTPTQKEQKILELARKRILTEQVFQQLPAASR